MVVPGGGGWPAQGHSGERRTRPVGGIEGGGRGAATGAGNRSEVTGFREGAELSSYAAMAQVATPSSCTGVACDARVARRVRM